VHRSSLHAALASLTLLLAACGGSTPAAAPASAPAGSQSAAKPAASGGELQSLIDGAKKEGTLLLSYGGSTFGGNDGIQQLAAGFNKAYGLNVTAQYTVGDSMPNMDAKITQEFQAKKPASTDVLLSLADTFDTPMAAHAVQAVDWRSWAPNIQKVSSPDVLAPDGTGVVVQTFVAGVSYNSNKLKGDQLPKTMDDLLKPQYKGHIAGTPYAVAFDWLATDSMWGYQKTLDYLTKFKTQISGVLRCGEQERIASGEFDMLALDCSQGNALSFKAKGAPLDYLVPSDAVLEEYVYAAVPATAPHPNTAKLWINYLLSPDAQAILRKVDYADFNLLPDSFSAKLLEQTQNSTNTKAVIASVQYATQHYLPDGPKHKEEFSKLLIAK
jgi:ABC-type Fe3+ transport system substrate-binding protein